VSILNSLALHLVYTRPTTAHGVQMDDWLIPQVQYKSSQKPPTKFTKVKFVIIPLKHYSHLKHNQVITTGCYGLSLHQTLDDFIIFQPHFLIASLLMTRRL
jgi:hypothetical protein